jgi:xanthine dehydrogenase molybdenum-binding subunit
MNTIYKPRVKRKYVGTYRPKIDSKEKTMGKIQYFADVTLEGKFPNMLYGKILNSPYGNATIKSMKTEEAEKLPGVYAVLRYDDPEIRNLKPTTHAWTDTAITPYHRDTIPRFFDRQFLSNTARWVGDQMGVAVAAESEEIAEEALSLIEIEWDVKPVFLEVEDSMKPGANILHPELNPKSNQLILHGAYDDDITLNIGNVDKALKEADEIIEVSNRYGGTASHGTLDFRGCLIDWTDEKLNVWTNHYYVDQTRMYLHVHLGVPLAKIRVRNGYCGAHMGKWNTGEDIFYVVLSILSKRAGRPIKYQMSVHEEFHDGRNHTTWKIKMAAKKDGTITAMDFHGIGNSGAYFGACEYNTEFIIAQSVERILAPIENIRVKSQCYFTNRLPGGVTRGIGNIQLAFSLCQAVDEIAEKLCVDPIEIIKKNFGDAFTPKPNKSIAAVLDKSAEIMDWNNRKKSCEGELIDGCKKKGKGMAFWNEWHSEWQETARGRIEVAFRINPDLSVILNAPTCETGAGGNSALVFACADNLSFLNVTPKDITWIAQNDSEMGLRDCPPTDSIVSFLMAEAMPEAAKKVKEEFCKRASLLLNIDASALDVKDSKVFAIESPDRYVSCKDVMMDVDCVPIYAHVVRDNNKHVTGQAFMAWFVDVTVDIETGKVEVEKMSVVNDCGQVMHASGAESQQIGGQCMGLGEALTEDICYDKATGTPLNFNYLDYKMPVMADYPDIVPALMEVWRGAGVYGASGIAEGAVTGTAAAIANAIYNAVGIRINSVPIKPEKILNALAKKEKGAK